VGAPYEQPAHGDRVGHVQQQKGWRAEGVCVLRASQSTLMNSVHLQPAATAGDQQLFHSVHQPNAAKVSQFHRHSIVAVPHAAQDEQRRCSGSCSNILLTRTIDHTECLSTAMDPWSRNANIKTPLLHLKYSTYEGG